MGFGSSQVIRFASNLILTRLLLPQHFGLSAIVGMFVNGFQQLSDIGLGPAIIQSPRGDEPRSVGGEPSRAVRATTGLRRR